MSPPIELLTALVTDLGLESTLDGRLQILADRAAIILQAPRTSVRLLNATRTRLIAAARAGAPLHQTTGDFTLGEGLLGWIAAESKPIRTGDADHDPRFVARPGMTEPMGSFVGVPIVAGGLCIGVLSALAAGADHFTEEHEQLLTLMAAMCAPHLEVARLLRLSQVDPLTGALNRRGLDLAFPEVAPRENDVLDGTISPLCVAMADIDHFKRINDDQGHAAGDRVLSQVAALLSGVLRAGDAVVRYGGEEFLLILPGVDLSQAASVAERARAAVEGCPMTVQGGSIHITLSVGVAERRAGEARDALIARADAAMYAVKSAGRNGVRTAP